MRKLISTVLLLLALIRPASAGEIPFGLTHTPERCEIPNNSQTSGEIGYGVTDHEHGQNCAEVAGDMPIDNTTEGIQVTEEAVKLLGHLLSLL